MADGRAYTDYRPRCESYPVRAAGIWGQHDARQRTIADTDSFMQGIHQILNTKMGSSKCSDTMVPELYKRVCTWKGCETVPGHYAGIVTGRVYVPNAAAASDDPDGLAKATIPAMANTYSMEGNDTPSQCAANDSEKLWQFLDTPKGYSARATPYSGPRA
jgi:hypothetical protein